MNQREAKPVYKLRGRDFRPWTGKEEYIERNRGREKENPWHYYFNFGLLGAYNFAIIGGTALGLAVWLEKFFEVMGR